MTAREVLSKIRLYLWPIDLIHALVFDTVAATIVRQSHVYRSHETKKLVTISCDFLRRDDVIDADR